jgi:NADPH-dependent ferric siderophore reductase
VIRIRRPGHRVLTYEMGPRGRWAIMARVGDRVVIDGIDYRVARREWTLSRPFEGFPAELVVDLALPGSGYAP